MKLPTLENKNKLEKLFKDAGYSEESTAYFVNNYFLDNLYLIDIRTGKLFCDKLTLDIILSFEAS